jgi:hypothetical protein
MSVWPLSAGRSYLPMGLIAAVMLATGSTAAPPAGDQLRFEYQTRLTEGWGLGIVREQAPVKYELDPLTELPQYDPDSSDSYQVDVRSRDVSSWDLRNRLDDLLHANFDTGTRWPKDLPQGFDPEAIMEAGKNPGLHVRDLHELGITGKGVGIAVVDEPLLSGHSEYRDSLRLYEEIHVPRIYQGDTLLEDSPASMHGTAEASLAVGRSMGVAPGADLYFIAMDPRTYIPPAPGTGKLGSFELDLTWLAKSIDRVLEINQHLPSGASAIRVMSIPMGWTSTDKGHDAVEQAVKRAEEAGVAVICSSLEKTAHLMFDTLNRDPRKDPDSVSSYGPGSWWAKDFLNGTKYFPVGTRLLVPAQSRTMASPTGKNDYNYHPSGGASWAIPYLAGLFALAYQVSPSVTLQEFWDEGLRTGKVVKVNHDGRQIDLGNVAQPVALIDVLKKRHPVR